MNFVEAVSFFVSLLFKVGITEGPAIADAIRRAIAGTDPLEGLAKERVDEILPELKLKVSMAAERVRVEHEIAGSPLIAPV